MLKADRSAFATTERENPYALLDQLGRVLTLVENEYVDPVDRKVLMEGALEGMVAKLDPHSSYLPPEDYSIFQSDTEGHFGGVGVEVDFGEDWVTVMAVIESSPAERAGIRPGDRIVAIDHVAVRGKNEGELIRTMRGAPGTKVLLTVSRPGADRYLYFVLTREDINVMSIVSKRLVGNVGYLRIKSFQQATSTELLQHVAELRKTGGFSKGLILDLRNNPGGLVNEASAIADEFLAKGVVFTTRRRGRIVDEVQAAPSGALQRDPVVVLVNELTASAAELLAAALQDNQRARVVGAPTFGKGSVQSIIDLPGGAGLRLTTLRYFSPGGRAIQAQGIKPDVLVPTPTGEFGIIREKNLPDHLPAEPGGNREAPPVAIEPVQPPSADAAAAASNRSVPDDPRTGSDPALAIAYQMLTGALSTPATSSAPR